MNQDRADQVAQATFEYFESIIEPLIMQEALDYQSGTSTTFARRVTHAERLLATHTSLSTNHQAKLVASLKTFLERPKSEDFSDRLTHYVRTATVAVVQTLGNAWMAAVREGVTMASGQAWLRLDTLDEAMMPRNNAHSQAAFKRCIEEGDYGALTAEEGWAYLQHVKSTLPQGAVLPLVALQYLEVSDVIVIR